MNILFDKNLPTKELSREKLIIEIRTTSYVISRLFLSSSLRDSSVVNFFVKLKARKKLTARLQRFIIRCKTTIRKKPHRPPYAYLNSSL